MHDRALVDLLNYTHIHHMHTRWYVWCGLKTLNNIYNNAGARTPQKHAATYVYMQHLTYMHACREYSIY